MKEKIENKLEEKIQYILSKKAEELTKDEYDILDSKLGGIKFEEIQKQKNEGMAEIVNKFFSN